MAQPTSRAADALASHSSTPGAGEWNNFALQRRYAANPTYTTPMMNSNDPQSRSFGSDRLRYSRPVNRDNRGHYNRHGTSNGHDRYSQTFFNGSFSDNRAPNGGAHRCSNGATRRQPFVHEQEKSRFQDWNQTYKEQSWSYNRLTPSSRENLDQWNSMRRNAPQNSDDTRNISCTWNGPISGQMKSDWVTASNELSIHEKLKEMPDIPVCFCRREAHWTHSTEFGDIYECHQMGLDSLPPPPVSSTEQQKYPRVCGFHIHKRVWDMFRLRLLNGTNVYSNDPELNVCPSFNYTFRVLFRANNDFPTRTPPLPNCLCGLTIVMHEASRETQNSITFSCPNYNRDGVKPKCRFRLFAEEVAFLRPKFSLHSLTATNDVTANQKTETMVDERTGGFDTLCKSLLHTSQEETSSDTSSASTASSLVPQSPVDWTEKPSSISEKHPSEPSAVMSDTLSEHKLTTCVHNHEYYNEAPNTEKPSELSIASRIVPMSVMKQHLLQQHSAQLDSEQVEPDAVDTTDHKSLKRQIAEATSAKADIALQNKQLKATYQKLASELETARGKLKELDLDRKQNRLKLLSEKGEYDQLQLQLTTMKMTLKKEVTERQASQRKAIQLEIVIADQLAEIGKLKQQLDEKIKAKKKVSTMKCTICFHEDIQCAIVPCYHCAYCVSCAEKLSHCAVCRTPKFEIQRVYVS